MASIEKRTSTDGSIKYHCRIRLKGCPTQTATFKRKTDASRWIQDTESAIRAGRYFETIESKKHTLDDLINRYCEEYLIRKKSGNDQLRHLTWWSDEIGYTTLSDVTPALITECRSKLANGTTPRGNQRTPATVNRYLSSLSHVFSIALREYQWVDDTPFRKVSTLKEPRGRIRFLDDDERARLLNRCKEHSEQLYLIVVLALSTGARRGEILSLTWQQVSFKRQQITLTETKNGEIRAIPLTGHALDLVGEIAKVRRIDSDLVFPSHKNPNQPIEITNVFTRAVVRAEIDDFRFHDLRHSAASYLAMNGASLAEIAAVLGHKTLSMVQRYSHISESHTNRIVASMNSQIFRGV